MEKNTVILDREIYDKLAEAYCRKNVYVSIDLHDECVQVESRRLVIKDYNYQKMIDDLEEFIHGKGYKKLVQDLNSFKTLTNILKDKLRIISSKWWFKLFAPKELKNELK